MSQVKRRRILHLVDPTLLPGVKNTPASAISEKIIAYFGSKFTQVIVVGSDLIFAIANANTAWLDAEAGKDVDVALGMAQKARSMEPNVPRITGWLG